MTFFKKKILPSKQGLSGSMLVILVVITMLVVVTFIVGLSRNGLDLLGSFSPTQGSQVEQNAVNYIKEIIGSDPTQAISLCDSFLKEYPKSKLIPEVFYLKLYATTSVDISNDGSSHSLLSSFFFDMLASENGKKSVESFSSSTSSEDNSYKASAEFYSGLLAIRSAKPDPEKMVSFLKSYIPDNAIFLTPDFASTLRSSTMPYSLKLPAESFEYAGVAVLVDSKYCEEVAEIYLNKTQLNIISSSYFDSHYFDAIYTYFFTHCDSVAEKEYTVMIDEYVIDHDGGQGISRLRDTLYRSPYKNTIKHLDSVYITAKNLQPITD